jgi:hypothetical protein
VASLLAGLASSLGLLTSFAMFLLRRYRKTVLNDLVPLRTYVWGEVRLWTKRLMNPAAAGPLGLRRYAKLRLSTFPTRLDSGHANLPVGGHRISRSADS